MNNNPSLIDEFIELIKAFPNFEYEFEYGNKIFHGLKLKKYEQYPWKNKKEEKTYDKKYMEHETEAAYLETIKWMNIKLYEKIHILFSWAYVLRMSSVFMIMFSIFNIALHAYMGALIYIVISLILFLINKLLVLKGSNLGFSRSFTESILHMGIDQLKEESEKKNESQEKKES